MSKKTQIITMLFITAIAAAILYFPKKNSELTKIDGPAVTTSFYPIYFLAKEIMGERGSVYNITPAGAEPHDYELTSKDRMRLEKSNLLIINGVNFESWGKNIESLIPKTKVLRVAEAFMFEGDPHVWLDPTLLSKEVKLITDELISIDPDGEKIYLSNSANLIVQLGLMDESFRNGLSNCEKRDIVTAHEAFSYLARRYGFNQISIVGISPDSEPSPQALAEVSKFAKNNNIKYIFFESLVSPKLAETVASEVGAKTLVLNPLEGLSDQELASGNNFFTEMKKNLDNLRLALVCQ